MKMARLFLMLVLTLSIMSCADSSESTAPVDSIYPDLSVYEFDATKDLVKLVFDAGELLKTEGEAIFETFDTQEWYLNDKYIFVLNTDGTLLYNPNNEENVGKDQRGFKDLGGKDFIIHMMNEVNRDADKPFGWTHYQWFRPRSEDTTWKTSFLLKITADNGNEYILGSGLYDMQSEKEFAKSQVNIAVQLIETEGEAAYDKIRDNTNIYVFRDSYVFIIAEDGEVIVHPMKPELEGTNMLNDQDVDGKEFVKDFVSIINSSGSGWTTYKWPKTVDADPSEKHTFVKKVVVGDRTFVVGAGMFYD